MKRTKIGATLSSATSTATVENNTTPFVPGTDIVVSIDVPAAGPGVLTAKIEQSVDDSTWTDLFAPAAFALPAGAVGHVRSATVTCPRYIRGTISAYTTGSALFYMEKGL